MISIAAALNFLTANFAGKIFNFLLKFFHISLGVNIKTLLECLVPGFAVAVLGFTKTGFLGLLLGTKPTFT